MKAASERWARSGLALLTGGVAPVLPTRDYAGRLSGLLDTARGAGVEIDPRVFTERAAELGLTRRGATSANGTARMVKAADGWLAVNLARPEDAEAVPAWVGCGLADDPWLAVERAARLQSAAELAQRGQDLGIPAAVVGQGDDVGRRSRDGGACVVRMAQGQAQPITTPLVIDLSSLWAGPLCAHLLGLAGARVVKVESAQRPDAARHGPQGFYHRLHAGHQSVVLDFRSPAGLCRLARLVARADVVIESTRPRALEQLGIDLNGAFKANPALVWVSITAYGRSGPWSNRVGFGDDAAASGGLVVWDEARRPMFAGDALADPVAGLTAATGALSALAGGGGMLVDVALREAAAYVAEGAVIDRAEREEVEGAEDAWRWRETRLVPPRARPVGGLARSIGADTDAVLAEFA